MEDTLLLSSEQALFINYLTICLFSYLNVMRDKYQKHGAPLELPQETKKALHLSEPSNWTIQRLFQAQNIMVEPLVLYW
jgi:hypothetical protein